MKKLKLFFACLLMAVLSIGQVWATEELKATLDFTTNTSWGFPVGSGNGLTAENSYSDGTYTVTLAATTKYYFNNDGYLMIGKSGSTLALPAFAWKTTKIVVTGNSAASKDTKQNIYVGENAVSTETTSSKTTQTYQIASTAQAAGTIYMFKVTSNHNAQVTKIEIYGEQEGGNDPVTVTGVSLNKASTSIVEGMTETLVATVAPGNASDKSVSWSSDDENVATVDGGVVTAVAAGTATITVTTTDGSFTDECEVTVTEAPAAVNYEKVTAEPADWSGEYILVYESSETAARVWKGEDQANNYAEATISAGVIAAPEGAAVLTIAKVAESDPVVYTIMVGEKYIGQTSNSNGIKIQDAAINNSLSMESNGVGIVASEAHLRYNSASSSYFRYYKSSTYSSQNPIQLYKKADGKQNTGLSYAEIDKKKLTKQGEAFTAPTLVNTNGLTVTYSSNNTTVAEVDASTGAVTINAVGVAIITASFAGNDDYKAGSASYTIGVTTHAGSDADPYNAIDAKNVIDVMGTKPNAYVSGKISSIITTSSNFDPENGYIWFYISDDGATTGQQIEAFKCLGLSSAKFTAVTDVVEGATVVITGTLKKYQSTYELDQDCYLESYTAPEEPKTPIVSSLENPITVAAAHTYLDAPATYDLSQAVWVRGVVTNIGQTNGQTPIPYIDVKDANAENSFRFFNYTINASITEEPQAGDILIATGLLDKYNSTYELNGCEVVSLVRPEVAVSSVAMTESTAEVEVGSTVTLHASVLPENATNKAITWSVQSGSDYASVDAGVVTGNAEGEAVIRAASTADPTKYAECTVTVTAVDPTKHVVTFDATADKTAEDTELSLTKGDLTIAITDGDGRFNNETDYRVYKNSEFTVSCANGNITKIEMTCTAGNDATGFEDAEGLVQATGTWTGNAASVSLIASVKQVRIETITITYKEDNRLDAGLAYAEAAINKVNGDDAFINPLTNTNSVDVTYETSDDQVAEVANDGTVTIIGEGAATITASFAGDETYKPANVSYTITVSAAPLTDYYEKVTETAGIVEGTYLIVYEAGNVAFNGGLTTLDAENNTIDVEITNDHKIGVTQATAAATFYIDPTAGSIQAANGKYIGVGGNSNGLKTSDNADTYTHNFSIDGDGNAVIAPNFEGSTMSLRYNAASNQARFRYYKDNGQQAIQLYKLANEVVKANPELAWSGNVEITIDGEFTAPTIGYAAGLDAEAIASITYGSDNENVATVTNAGVISLADPRATGTAHITATFPGNDTYKGATAQCTIKVNPAHSIYVSPSLTVNFGSVVKDATVDDKVITVTLTGVDGATAVISGDGASAFEFTPATLTTSGNITISASSATVGTFNAKLTISDDAGVATSRDVTLKLTVTDPADEETPISTTTKWVAATEITDGMQVIITDVNHTYAMGEQKSTNRAAYVATIDGEGVLTPGEGTMAFTLVAQGDGTYAIRTSNGKFLYAAKNDANHLKTQDEVDVNAKWTLTVASAVAEGSSNRNVMQVNGSGTNKLFACYATANQSAIQFYVPKPVTPPTPVYETVREGLTAGNYYTVCLPKQVTAVTGGTFWTLKHRDAGATVVYLEEETAPFDAGKPYIFQATATTLDVVYSGDAVSDPVENGALRGTFTTIAASAFATLPGNVYLLINNKICPRGTGNYLSANRAYIDYDALTVGAPSSAPGKRVRAIPLQGNAATGVDELNAAEAPVKMLIDGQIFILRGEKLYDTTGRLVK